MASSRCFAPLRRLAAPMSRPILLNHVVGVIAKVRSQFAAQRLGIVLGAMVHCREARGLFANVIFEILRRLEGRDGQKAEQHRIDEPIVGGGEYHHVIRLPFAVNRAAHGRMNENDADQRYRQEKRAQDQRQRPGGKAVQPGSQDFDHGRQAGFRRRRFRFHSGGSCRYCNAWPKPGGTNCSHDPHAGPLGDRRLERRVNQDLMGPRDGGDCGLPLKRDARRFGYRRFLHRLSDGWSASPSLRHGAGPTGRRFGDDVCGCRMEAAVAACV